MRPLNSIFIIGCGDIGRRVSVLAREKGCEITALSHSPGKFEPLHKSGIRIFSGDLDSKSTLLDLPIAGSTVFFFAPPPGGGIVDPRIRNFCDAVQPGHEPQKIIYLSTTGVYGDCGDMPVTEETTPNPQTSRARRRLNAETVISSWGRERGVPVVILRITGIYGPGRLPLQHLMSGTPLLSEEEAPITNRIHADDLARVCLAAAEKGENGDIFNVSDGEHSTMTHYFNAVADLLGIPRPVQICRDEAAKTMPPLLYSYFCESRRIDNRRMLEKLGIRLHFPTLAEGLKSCIPKEWPPPSASF
jgi:nucleoside-diphosphate-sugar epimerase